MLIGGTRSLVDAIKAGGGQVGPCAKWAGAWDLGTTLGGWDSFFKECKAAGLTPQVNAWLFGPSMNLVTNAAEATKRVALLEGIMGKAKAAGVAPWVMLEPEAALAGSVAYAAYWDRLLAAVRTCPGARAYWCPGVWVNHASYAAFYAKQIAAADGVGLQSVKFVPRHSIDGITNAPTELVNAFKAYPGKEHVLYDVLWSTYGGNYSTTFPFPGGDGKALEALQATTIQQLAAALPSMGVGVVVFRDLRDNLNVGANGDWGPWWGGWAEKFAGVQRPDGSKKPGFDALMALAKPTATPPPPTYTQAEMDAVKAALASCQAKVRDLEGRIALAIEALA